MDIKSILELASSGLTLINSLTGDKKDAATSTFGRGLAVATELVKAGQDVTPAIEALTTAFGGNKTEVTDAELDAVEVKLDAMIDEFNVEMPE